MRLRDLFPKQFDFFSMFNSLAQKVEASVHVFSKLLANPANGEAYSQEIHDLEEDADRIVHATIDKLHQTFITPMDRNNIHALLLKMDDIIDLIHAASQRIFLYKINTLTPDILALGELSQESVEKCCLLIHSLNNLKNPEELHRLCIAINHTENKADILMRQALVNLFATENDFKSFIKQKELIEILEDITDKAEGIAHLVEAVILEHT